VNKIARRLYQAHHSEIHQLALCVETQLVGLLELNHSKFVVQERILKAIQALVRAEEHAQAGPNNHNLLLNEIFRQQQQSALYSVLSISEQL
jgi:hypothetical protein